VVPTLSKLRVWPTGYRPVVPTLSNRLRDF